MTYADDYLIPLVDEGLGNSAYLADLGGGRALAVDASRDLRALREAAARRGLTVAFAADTHLHADFVSGAVQLAADEGATVLASAAGRRAFPHTPLADGDETDLGGLTLRALATPGHTDEHLSFLPSPEIRQRADRPGGRRRRVCTLRHEPGAAAGGGPVNGSYSGCSASTRISAFARPTRASIK